MRNNGMICQGRFLVDFRPVPSQLAASGTLYEWYVVDFDSDDDSESQGLADSPESAWTAGLTAALAMR